MYKLNSLVFSIVFIIICWGCKKEESKVLSTSSPDGAMHITVRGERATSLDPFTVYINLNHNNQDQEVHTEVYADKIDESNTKFEWQDNSHCLITFIHRDGQKNIVPVGVN